MITDNQTSHNNGTKLTPEGTNPDRDLELRIREKAIKSQSSLPSSLGVDAGTLTLLNIEYEKEHKQIK